MKVKKPDYVGRYPVDTYPLVDGIQVEGTRKIIVHPEAVWHQVAKHEYVVVVSTEGTTKYWHVGSTNSFFVASISDETANRLMKPDLDILAKSSIDDLDRMVGDTVEDARKKLGKLLGDLKERIES